MALRKDTSLRTKMITKYNRAFIAALLIILLGAMLYTQGAAGYDTAVKKSSSPIGTRLTFQRSDATVDIAGIYTDESRSVLIVRLASATASDTLKLPYKGSDYNVFLANDSYNAYAGQEVSTLFGRYSTNGDMFLVIPNPDNSVYNLFIQNTNYIATNELASDFKEDSSGDTSAANASTDEELVEELMLALNEYKYTDLDERSDAIQIEGDANDVIGFRVTLDPAFTTDEYRAQVIPGTLLTEDGEFDFEGLFNSAFKETATDTIEAQYKAAQNQETLLKERIVELRERLKENPNDASAKSLLESVQSQLTEVEGSLEALSEAYDQYESVSYKPSMFKNMQTKAQVVSTDEAAQAAKTTTEN